MPSALVLRAGVSFEDREFWNSSLLISEAVTALICSPIFGYVLDVSGTRQGPYLAGLVLLFASMVIFTASRSVLWYTVARILQGGATAMVTVAGFAIVTDAVDKHHLGQMLGYIGTAMTLGFVSGPVLGGVVYSIGGFYAAFGMAFAIITLDLALRLAVIEKKVAERFVSSSDNGVVSPSRDHDHNNQSYGSAQSTPRGPKPPRPDGSLALFKLLRQPRVLIALWAVIVSAIVASAFDAALTIFVETIFHWDVLGAGLIFIPGASAAILQPFFGYLTDRLGSRIIAFSSFAILSPTLILLRLVEKNTFQHKAILCVILATVGMCIDLGEPALLVELQKVLDDMEAEDPRVFGGQGAVGQAFGLQSMAHFGGFALGPIIGGFVSFHYGWNVMTFSLGLLSLVTAVPMMWLSGPIQDDHTISETGRDPLMDY
ncbi:hypothetical protein N7481_008182 [Penicillium waksmanii]|uniref:uncharacterized protein n=1 Tax=Penicillium waksmanii TaxID=69791 RepID=UPI002549440E|nr:uncharacterized protein N7481_008182 [Penicillium waksmanii]KAJ5980884.1 hypothetical protein N7481_008182 [Penicillium waksmanii]